MITTGRMRKVTEDCRIKVLDRKLGGEQERKQQLTLLVRRLEEQLKEALETKMKLENELKSLRKCASCSNLDERTKTYNLLNNQLQGSTKLIKSLGAPHSMHNLFIDDMEALKSANRDLERCVYTLQKELVEKDRRYATMEEHFNRIIDHDKRMIIELQKQAEMYGSSVPPENLERADLVRRIQELEKGKFLREDQLHDRPNETNPVNRYCESCREKLIAWEKMLGTNRKGLKNTTKTSHQKDADCLVKEIADIKERLENQAINYEKVIAQMKANENTLRRQKEMADAELEKMWRMHESLETEFIEQQRDYDLLKRQLSKVNCERNRDKDGRTNYELEMARDRIKRLEVELESHKKAVNDARYNAQRESHAREVNHLLNKQTSKIRQLETEVKELVEENKTLNRKCNELEQAKNLAVQEKLRQAKVINTLRQEIKSLEKMQEESARAHAVHAVTCRQLLNAKEERAFLIDRLCKVNYFPEHVIAEMEFQGRAERERINMQEVIVDLIEEKKTLKERIYAVMGELDALNEKLKNKEKEVTEETLLRQSLHDDLAKARSMLLEREGELRDRDSELKKLEVKIHKLKIQLANANDLLKTEQMKNETSKAILDELEDLLQKKSTELVAAALERQQLAVDMQKLKETKSDLETKLVLQGRDLKEARKKMLILKQKVKDLEDELTDSSEQE